MATKKRDYYEILGLSGRASAEEVRRAYRKLAFVISSGVEKSLTLKRRFLHFDHERSTSKSKSKRRDGRRYNEFILDPRYPRYPRLI